MSTSTVKKFLANTFSLHEKYFKRISKKTLSSGTEIREFHNLMDSSVIETFETNQGVIGIVGQLAPQAPAISADYLLKTAIYKHVDYPPALIRSCTTLPSYFNFHFDSYDADIAQNVIQTKNIHFQVQNLRLWICYNAPYNDYIDQGACLIDAFLPSYIVEQSCESCFEMDTNQIITLQQLVKDLEAIGLQYNRKECPFAPLYRYL